MGKKIHLHFRDKELRAQAFQVGCWGSRGNCGWTQAFFFSPQPDFRMTFRPTSPSPRLASPAFLRAIMHSRRAPVAKRSQNQGRATPSVRPGKDGALVRHWSPPVQGLSAFCSEPAVRVGTRSGSHAPPTLRPASGFQCEANYHRLKAEISRHGTPNSDTTLPSPGKILSQPKASSSRNSTLTQR